MQTMRWSHASIMRRMRAASCECHTLDSKCLALGRSWSTVIAAALGNKANRRIRSTRPRDGCHGLGAPEASLGTKKARLQRPSTSWRFGAFRTFMTFWELSL
jgi:hypothetical protein